MYKYNATFGKQDRILLITDLPLFLTVNHGWCSSKDYLQEVQKKPTPKELFKSPSMYGCVTEDRNTRETKRQVPLIWGKS